MFEVLLNTFILNTRITGNFFEFFENNYYCFVKKRLVRISHHSEHLEDVQVVGDELTVDSEAGAEAKATFDKAIGHTGARATWFTGQTGGETAVDHPIG